MTFKIAFTIRGEEAEPCGKLPPPIEGQRDLLDTIGEGASLESTSLGTPDSIAAACGLIKLSGLGAASLGDWPGQ